MNRTDYFSSSATESTSGESNTQSSAGSQATTTHQSTPQARTQEQPKATYSPTDTTATNSSPDLRQENLQEGRVVHSPTSPGSPERRRSYDMAAYYKRPHASRGYENPHLIGIERLIADHKPQVSGGEVLRSRSNCRCRKRRVVPRRIALLKRMRLRMSL